MLSITQISAEIRSVSDLLDIVKSFMPLNEPDRHLKLWTRGQGDSSWDLQPGVYRKSGEKEFASSEEERLRLESHLTRDFRALGAGILTGRETQAELYFIQQHYGMPTRLLDWNTNPLAALWFAVSSKHHPETDGMVALMDVYELLQHQGAKNSYKDKESQVLRGIASTRAPYFEKALKPIFEWGNVNHFPDFIIPIRPDYSVKRLNLQRGCFTFHVPQRPVLTNREIEKLEMTIVPKECKSKLRLELASIGVDNFSIYGDLEALSNKLKYAYGVG